jgi:Fibronectin type III domain
MGSLVAGGGSHALGVQWSAPADDGGAPIQYHLIHVDHYGTLVLGDSIAAPATSTFETLDFGYNYDVSVAAYNGVGSGVGGWCHVSPVNMNP